MARAEPYKSMRWFFSRSSSAARALARSRADENARIWSIRRRRAWFVMLLHACRRVDSVRRAAQGGGRRCSLVWCRSARRGAWRSIAPVEACKLASASKREPMAKTFRERCGVPPLLPQKAREHTASLASRSGAKAVSRYQSCAATVRHVLRTIAPQHCWPMRLLASFTLTAAVHALAPLRDSTTARSTLCRIHGDWKYLAPVRTTNGANSLQARRGGPRRRARGVLRSSPDDVDDEVVASDADFGGAVIPSASSPPSLFRFQTLSL